LLTHISSCKLLALASKMTGAAADTALGHLQGLQNNANPIWWKDAGLRRLMVWFVCIFISQMTAGYDESLIGSFQAMKPWLLG